MKFYFPIHLDAGNRGCEGIAKGTALLLKEDKNKLVGLCTDICLDKRMQIDKYVTLYKAKDMTFVDKIRKKIYCKIIKNTEKRETYNYHYYYDSFLNQMTKEDVLISTGGDMMCYGNNEVIYTTENAHNRGIKTVLWGCSMGEMNLTKEKESVLRKFNLIYARESLSYSFFRNLGLKNVICSPDPAFILEPESVPIPSIFEDGDVVGINVSNYVMGGFSLDTNKGKQIVNLINYILDNTEMYILLVPHVTWKRQDDRVISKLICHHFNRTSRIYVLDITNLNYCQIRHVISHCRFFIGGRTHSVISAYSTCVPTIALGYSIKSHGIARDLGLSEKLVYDNKAQTSYNELIDSFKYLRANEDKIRNRLESTIPNYKDSFCVQQSINEYLKL